MLKPFIRSLAFFGKETKEIIRQPSVLLTLIIGPFLILLLFGVGTMNVQKPLRLTLVLPPGGAYSQQADQFAKNLPENVHLQEITTDENAAMTDLRTDRTDVVTVVPNNMMDQLAAGQQATIRVYYKETSPVEDNYMRYIAYTEVQQLNKQLLISAIEQGRLNSQWAIALGNASGSTPGVGGPGSSADTSKLAQAAENAPPEVLAEPFKTETQNVSAVKPGYVSFYTPAVIALLVQHIAITFMALSLVRERTLGTTELFKVAPATPKEILFGKYVSIGILTVAVGAILTWLSTQYLGVPFLGSVALFLATEVALTFAALGVGMLISLISGSEKQAVQLTMLVLIASVFFSGFFMPLYMFRPALQVFSYLLPATLGVKSFQGVFLNGVTNDYMPVIALALMGLVFAFFAWRVFRRELR